MNEINNPEKISELISVITPAWNAASFIRETIDSVRSQTYENWEMLIADDGSTDETVSIVEIIAAADSRIKLILPDGETGLAAHARNRAMVQAQGELFAFVDADDLWEPKKLKRQLDYLREHPEVDGLCTLFSRFGDEETVRLSERMKDPTMSTVCTRSEVLQEGLPMLTSTVLFRRKCYDEIGGMDEDPRLRSGQDMEYFARLIMNFNFHRILEPLTRYRIAAPTQALSSRYNQAEDPKGWKIFRVLEEKGLFTPEEIKIKRSNLYCTQAHQNLFYYNAPYRRYLVRSVLEGKPPFKAFIMLALCFLPAPLLRPLLLRLRGSMLWWKTRKYKGYSTNGE